MGITHPQGSLASTLAIVAVILAFARPALATNYYVAASGSDGNNGTQGSPFATIQKGANVAQPGDTVFVGDGRYAGFGVVRGGTSNANRVVFKSINKHGAVIDTPSSDGGNGIVVYSMSNCLPNHTKDYVTIDGFRIENAPYRGVSMFGTVGLHVRNCYIYNCKDGAQGSNNKDTVYEGNVFDANALESQYYHHLYFSEGSCCDTSAPMSGLRIRNNVFKDARVGSAVHFMSHTPGHKYEDVIIEGNLFLNNAGKDINAPGIRASYIRNNVFRTQYDGHGCINFERPGPYSCGTPDSPDSCYIYNNTFIAPNTRGIYFRDVASLGPFDAEGYVVFNNLIFAQTASMAIVDESGGGPNIAGNLTYGFNESGVATILANMFEDYANNDLRLREGATAIDAGLPGLDQIVAPSTDMVGTARPPNAVDVGAYEFGAAPPPEEDLAAPQGVTLGETQLGCLDVSWQRNTEVSLAGYRVYYGLASVASGEASAYADSLDAGVLTTAQICQLVGRYYVAVRAYSSSGALSPPSNELRLFVLGSTPQSALQVGYWALDEGGGIVAGDSWGNHNAALVDGAAWNGAGAVAGAVAFDGVNDRLEINGLDIPDGPGMTIAFWCHADDFEVPDARLVSKATSSAEQDHFWMVSTVNQTGLRYRLRSDGQTTTIQTGTGQVQAGRWYHIAAVYDGSRMRLYKDGVQIASAAKSGIVDTDAGAVTAIGNQPTGAGERAFDGMIDDVRLYRRALSAADLAALIAMRTNAAPVASFTASATTGIAPVDISFDASASSDPEGDPLSYSWDFGDGGTGSGVGVSHTYTLAGEYDVVLTVIDDHDNTDMHSISVTIGEQTTPPAIPQLQFAVESDPGCVTVGWTPNAEPNLAGYTLYYGTESVEGGDATTYPENVVLGTVSSWRDCSFAEGRYYFALRARNDAGQLSGYSTEMALDVVGPDVIGPTIIPLNPSDGAAGVSLQSTVRFVVLDDRSSVDTGTMLIRIDGQAPADVQFQPDTPGYTVTCTPASAFSPNTLIDVDVSARDTATQPNTGTKSWTFTTVSVPPAAPTGLAAAGGSDGTMSLSWNANGETDLAGYRLYYGTAAGTYTDSLTTGLTTGYVLSGLADGTYHVAIRAYNTAGQASALSNEASATVTNPAQQGPTPPQSVQVAESAPGCMMVTWQPSSDSQVTGYYLHYGTESVAQGQTGIYFNSVDVKSGTTHEVCNLDAGTYFVAVRAYRSVSETSTYSTEKNVVVSAPDLQAPAAALAYPIAGAADVPQNTKVFFVLSDDDSGIDTTSVSIRIGNVTPASMTFTGDINRLGVVCDLGDLLPPSSAISVDVTVADLADPANTATRSWSFTTGSAADVAPPAFVSYSPADGSQDVDPNAELRVQIEDDTGVDQARIQLFINGDEVEVEVQDAGGGRVDVSRLQPAPFAPGRNNVRVVAYDTSDNRAELLYDFNVAELGADLTSGDVRGEIVPDGFWADDPNRPLEIRNLPLGWTVRIFTTAGVQVRSHENNEEEGTTWQWDFRNNHGQEVARALYLVRVVDDSGHVQRSGKFIVRLTQ